MFQQKIVRSVSENSSAMFTGTLGSIEQGCDYHKLPKSHGEDHWTG